MSSKSKEWLLYNAVLTWVFHYADRKESNVDDELVAEYKLLQEELRQVYEQSNNIKTRKRGRPAKRQRTKETTSNPSSTEESKATNQEA